MNDLVQAFIDSRSADGCTKKTLTWHRTSLSKFMKWAEAEGRTDIPNLTNIHIRRYIATLQESGLSATSVGTYVRSLRAWLNWLYQEELMLVNISIRVREPKAPQIQKPPFTQTELRKLLSAAAAPRDKAILALLLDCGLRADELCTLRTNDVVFENRTLTVMGKGRKMRSVPFSARTATILRKAMLKNEGEFALPSRTGEALTPNGLLQAVMRIGKKAGVEDVHPHKFRHTFAISYLRNGGDPLSLQRILGHATLSMSNRYVLMASADVQRVHDIASPMANLLGGSGKGR